MSACINFSSQAKRYEEAIKCYTEAIDIDTTNDGAYAYFGNRAACHLALGSWDKASEDAAKSISLKPDFAKGYADAGSKRSQMQGMARFQ